MTLRFASQSAEWTDSMKNLVRDRLVTATENELGNSRFDMSVHLNDRTPSGLEIWLVLQTHDRQLTEILRGRSLRFEDVVESLRKDLDKKLRFKEAL